MQPIVLEFWPAAEAPADAPYTSIMSWRTDSFRGIGKDKATHLYSMIDLPTRSHSRILLAIAGRCPTELLLRHGWELTDAVAASIDANTYRDFIRRSRGELGFAKPMYIDTRSGWFSDRTQCYLAMGRPALVPDTGFSEILPCGEGLLVYDDEQGVLAGLQEIERDYPRHSRRAREIAAEFFAADKVVKNLLGDADLL